MMLRKTLLFLLATLTIVLILPYEKSLAEYEQATSEISGISVDKVGDLTEIQIESSSPVFSYTIYNPEDPYKVVVELQGLDLGKFKDKMVIEKAGVSEIEFSKVEGAAKTIRLDITLAVPADIKPTRKGKTLVLTFNNADMEQAEAAAEKELPAAEAEKEQQASEKKEILEEAVSANATTIDNIEVVKSGNKIDFVIHGDGKMSPKVFETEGNKVVLDIPDVSTKIDSYKAYEPPVTGIRIGKYANKTRLVFDMMEPSRYDVSTEDKEIRVSFEKPEIKAARAKAPAIEKELPEAPKILAEYKPESFVTKKYSGEKISLDFQDADLIHIFRLIADVSGYNIVVSPQVKGRFSMKLIDVPWDQALDIILRNYGLSKTVESNIIRIAPTADIAREEKDIAEAKEAALKAGDLETKIYKINYATVEELQKAINDVKSERGKISIDSRTSTVIIKDVEAKQKELAQVIKTLDAQIPQVNIEAKIVEVSTNFSKELGIQWGVLWKPTPQTQIGGTGLAAANGFFSGNPLLVNLPAAVGGGAGGTIGFGFISAKDFRALDLQLSALENSGLGKVISNPRVTTLDNRTARITQGTQVPYKTTDELGKSKTDFKDADLELSVTPHITPEGTIVMDIFAKNDSVDTSVNTAGDAGPPINKKQVKTNVLIKDGDTMVLGGIFKTNTSKNLAGIPALSKLPVLGWLFKKETSKDDITELLIFITPRVVQ